MKLLVCELVPAEVSHKVANLREAECTAETPRLESTYIFSTLFQKGCKAVCRDVYPTARHNLKKKWTKKKIRQRENKTGKARVEPGMRLGHKIHDIRSCAFARGGTLGQPQASSQPKQRRKQSLIKDPASQKRHSYSCYWRQREIFSAGPQREDTV